MATLSSKLALLRLAGMLLNWLDKWLKRKTGKIRKPAEAMPQRRSETAPAGHRRDSSRNLETTRRPGKSDAAAAPEIIIRTGAMDDTALSAPQLRRRLRDPQSLRQAIVINELLSKPLALRRQGRR